MIYQTFWSRVAASFIDSLLLCPLVLFVNGEPGQGFSLWLIPVLIMQHSYYIIGHAQYGQTLGKRILGVKVVQAGEHQPATWMEALLRQSLLIFISIMYMVPYIINRPSLVMAGVVVVLADAIVAMVHPQHRSLRDFIAKTVVVRVNG